MIRDFNILATATPTDKLKLLGWWHLFNLQDKDDIPYSVVMGPSPTPSGGAIVAAVLTSVFDSYWGGMILSASMFSGMISVANRRGARRLADLCSRHEDGLITGSEHETEREHIIHPPIPDYWSAVIG